MSVLCRLGLLAASFVGLAVAQETPEADKDAPVISNDHLLAVHLNDGCHVLMLIGCRRRWWQFNLTCVINLLIRYRTCWWHCCTFFAFNRYASFVCCILLMVDVDVGVVGSLDRLILFMSTNYERNHQQEHPRRQ
jgi:hypothetical protein